MNRLPFVWLWYYLCSQQCGRAEKQCEVHWWSLSLLDEMGEKRGKSWQRHICIDRVVCGQWRPSVFECHLVLKPAVGTVYFLWLFLVPVETRPAYTRRLDESRCVLHAATQPDKPEFHFTDCMKSHESLKMSNRHLPIRAVSGVCECDAWVEASLRPCWVRILPVTMLCEGKSAAFSLMLCAACVPFDIVVKVRKIV